MHCCIGFQYRFPIYSPNTSSRYSSQSNKFEFTLMLQQMLTVCFSFLDVTISKSADSLHSKRITGFFANHSRETILLLMLARRHYGEFVYNLT